jgi:hypothetical protein
LHEKSSFWIYVSRKDAKAQSASRFCTFFFAPWRQNLATALQNYWHAELILLIREERTGGPLQRLGARYRVGCANAGRNDCDLHVSSSPGSSARVSARIAHIGTTLCICFAVCCRGPCFRSRCSVVEYTIIVHANLVKRVVFPLETLPAAQVFAALGNQLFATDRSADCDARDSAELHLTALWLPVLLIPQLIFALGAAWLIASLGVFLRDIAQGLTLLLMAWMYLTPIIYPESIVPVTLRRLSNFNPFTPLVRSYRRIFLDGRRLTGVVSHTSP